MFDRCDGFQTKQDDNIMFFNCFSSSPRSTICFYHYSTVHVSVCPASFQIYNSLAHMKSIGFDYTDPLAGFLYPIRVGYLIDGFHRVLFAKTKHFFGFKAKREHRGTRLVVVLPSSQLCTPTRHRRKHSSFEGLRCKTHTGCVTWKPRSYYDRHRKECAFVGAKQIYEK